MQSRINKEQENYLLERGFEVDASRRVASRYLHHSLLSAGVRQQITVRRSGWRWSAQSMKSYKMVGVAEGFADPIAAFVHAEVNEWRTGA